MSKIIRLKECGHLCSYRYKNFMCGGKMGHIKRIPFEDIKEMECYFNNECPLLTPEEFINRRTMSYKEYSIVYNTYTEYRKRYEERYLSKPHWVRI